MKYQAHSETSREAAERAEPHAGTQRHKILDYMKLVGYATDEQMQDALKMNPSTQRPRRGELVESGHLRDSGRTALTRSGRRAVVWEINDKSKEIGMATLYDVPERFCAKGHRITGKKELVEKRKDGSLVVTGYVNTSVLICETCAWEASGGETLEGMRHRPVKGKKLEKLGQETFLPDAASIFVK